MSDWMRDFMGDDEIAAMEAKTARIETELDTVYQVTLSAPATAVIAACRLYDAARNGDIEGAAFCGYLFGMIMDTLYDALEEDGIDYTES